MISMPTYVYECTECGKVIEQFQWLSEQPLLLCPDCNTETLKKIPCFGGNFILRGPGFHCNDYPSKEKKES
jgi:putative FmdB family regulatory protein